ncbi:hypothetical protein AV530_019497 [Patagioenas fasciata monilis]|uniref:Uncharacterized protein n=1 Tax=Patagioenas fasciata monilis TaxID=372326 RepID=A0A1V4JDU3_PATFA|nr:hypothetical protein AV530_019497 [Patagioenas fasciata monilis]
MRLKQLHAKSWPPSSGGFPITVCEEVSFHLASTSGEVQQRDIKAVRFSPLKKVSLRDSLRSAIWNRRIERDPDGCQNKGWHFGLQHC